MIHETRRNQSRIFCSFRMTINMTTPITPQSCVILKSCNAFANVWILELNNKNTINSSFHLSFMVCIEYYSIEIGCMKSINECDEANTKLWWWWKFFIVNRFVVCRIFIFRKIIERNRVRYIIWTLTHPLSTKGEYVKKFGFALRIGVTNTS